MKNLPVEDITGKRIRVSALTGIRTCQPSLRAVQGCITTVVN